MLVALQDTPRYLVRVVLRTTAQLQSTKNSIPDGSEIGDSNGSSSKSGDACIPGEEDDSSIAASLRPVPPPPELERAGNYSGKRPYSCQVDSLQPPPGCTFYHAPFGFRSEP